MSDISCNDGSCPRDIWQNFFPGLETQFDTYEMKKNYQLNKKNLNRFINKPDEMSTESNNDNTETDSNENIPSTSNNSKTKTTKSYENLLNLSVKQHMINMKNAIYGIWKDIETEKKTTVVIFTKDDRLFYLGLFLLIIFILYVILNSLGKQ